MGNNKVTRIKKDKTKDAKRGQFKNIGTLYRAGKMSQEEAERAVRELAFAKKMGGKIQTEFRNGGKVDLGNFKGQY
tara:strand:+ start:343 stop:570 length:228 start_codon:yes stop_codon:yes gene_type:complete